MKPQIPKAQVNADAVLSRAEGSRGFLLFVIPVKTGIHNQFSNQLIISENRVFFFAKFDFSSRIN